jgi:hypothetical protein
MALAGRSGRRGSQGSRWLVIGVVITLLVLLINASLQSRSQGPGQQLAAGAWVDRILPIITASNEQGNQVAAIWSNGAEVPGATLLAELGQTATAAETSYKQAVNLRPPADVAGPSGLLEAALYMRNKAINLLKTALQPILTGQVTTAAVSPAGISPTVLSAIQSVGDDLKIGDLAYQSFLESLPKLGVNIPPSAWGSNLDPYQPGPAQVFLTTLQNAQSVAPVHEIKIYSVTTSPPAVSRSGGVELLPDQLSILVTVVIADVGNQPEKGLTVTASIAPATTSSSVRVFEDLTPGQSYSIVGMGPLGPPQGVPVTLTLTVTPGAGSPAQPVTKTLVFEMPSPNTAPSTTVVGSSSATTPGGGTATSSTTTPSG